MPKSGKYNNNNNNNNNTIIVIVPQRQDEGFIYSPTDALVSCLKKNIKIYIKIYIKKAPTVSVLQLHNHQGTQ